MACQIYCWSLHAISSIIGRMDYSYDYLFKIIVVGDKRVGKSSLIKRFREGSFEEKSLPPTVGVDFHVQDVEIDGKLVKLQLWDTAGEEHYKAITSVYYRGANAAFVVFDMTNHETFISVKPWIEEVLMKCGSDVLIVIVGSKSDMEPHIDTHEIDEFADLYLYQWCATSAKDGTNVNGIFSKAARDLIRLQSQMLSLASASDGPGSLFLAAEDCNNKSNYCCSYI